MGKGKRAPSGDNEGTHLQDRSSSDLMEILVQNISDYAIVLLDLEGRVISWNPAAERLKGYTADEILGQSFTAFYTAEDIESGKPHRELKMTADEGRFEDEAWRVKKDGTRFWANVVFTPLRDKAGRLRGYGKVTRDLTERRLAEERIRKQAQEILEMSTVPVVQVWEGVVLVRHLGSRGQVTRARPRVPQARCTKGRTSAAACAPRPARSSVSGSIRRGPCAGPRFRPSRSAIGAPSACAARA